MCRLCALTDTTLPPDLRISWFDRMLLMSQADDSQEHAWGVSNGTTIYKDAGAYTAAPPVWTADATFEQKMLLGHVRKASPATGRGCEEAHPYVFDINGESLTCAHNGWFGGTNTHMAGTPDTDSWRAFNNLATLLRRTNDLKAVFEEWFNLYTTATQCGILIYWQGAVWAFRHTRPLHVCIVGQGYLINTSYCVLSAIRKYAEKINAVECGEIAMLPEHKLIRFRENNIKVQVHDIDVRLKVGYTQRTYNEYDYEGTAIIAEDKTTTALVPRTTPPAPYATGVTGRGLTKHSDQHTQILKTIASTANPMRLNMFIYWLAVNMNIKWMGSSRETIKIIGKADLDTFLEMRKPWQERQRALLDTWNKFVVEREHEVILLDILCPNGKWFWLNPEYTSLSAHDGQEKLRKDITQAKIQANIT